MNIAFFRISLVLSVFKGCVYLAYHSDLKNKHVNN